MVFLPWMKTMIIIIKYNDNCFVLGDHVFFVCCLHIQRYNSGQSVKG